MQMDWSESRFNDIQQKLKAFLKQAGFKVSQRAVVHKYFLVHLQVYSYTAENYNLSYVILHP